MSERRSPRPASAASSRSPRCSSLTVFENLELAQKTDKSVWASLRAR
jgi:hypothetical protein